MVIKLGSVLVKQSKEPVAAQGTLSFPDLVALFERMKVEDGRMVSVLQDLSIALLFKRGRLQLQIWFWFQ